MTAPILDLAAAPPTATLEVDLGHGVTAQLRPWSGLLACALDVQLAGDAEAVRSGDLSAWTLGEQEAAWFANPIFAAAFSVLVATAARAALRISSWNVVDAAGEPVPVNRFTLARLFRVGITGESGAAHMRAFVEAEAA